MRAELLELERRIREIEGRPAVARRAVASGVEALDLSGGLPCPGLVEVVGPVGSGRTRLALTWAAARTQAGEPVGWVDPGSQLYPPTAAGLGVAPGKLLMVRPGEAQAAWATEQLLRSGCFGLVVLVCAEQVPEGGVRLQQAARHGRCTLVLVSERPGRDVPADLRLAVQAGRVEVRRRRGGVAGQCTQVPAWPRGRDPWDDPEEPPWG